MPKTAKTARAAGTRAPKTRAKRPAAKASPEAEAPEPKKMSALDAAAAVLAESAEPLSARDLVERMAERGLWSSPAGRTPRATLYAAITREIAARSSEARFVKVGRGRFAIRQLG